MADAGTDPVQSRPDEHSWGEIRPEAVSSQAVGSGPPAGGTVEDAAAFRSEPSAAV